jgi:hypothetical protein
MPKAPTSFLIPYIKDEVKHINYDAACEKAHALRIHAQGLYPKKLIGERRPSESESIQAYREKIFIPITEPWFAKVFNSIGKIRESQDWSIEYPVETPIKEGETLRDYCEFNFPRNGSITNWFFSVALRSYMCDANAIVLTMPLSFNVDASAYLQPYPVIFHSEQIIDYKIDQFYLLTDKKPVTYTHQQVTYTNGVKYWLIQPDTIQSFEYLPAKDTVTETFAIANPIGYIPIRWMNGVVDDWDIDSQLYKSRFASVVPKWNEAIREYSDLQATVVQHLVPTYWSIQAQQCKACAGIGRVPDELDAPVTCRECKGMGTLPLNPYEHFQYKPAKPGEPQIPNPPIGPVVKDTEIVKLQAERIKEHGFDGFASLNYEFMAQVPLDQSGVAKSYDRKESDNTTHAVAEDVVRIIEGAIYDTNEWRYHMIVPDRKKREEMLPVCHVPQKFDLVSETYLIENTKALIEAGVDAAIVNQSQKVLAEKMFNTDPHIKDFVGLKLDLDPFAGMKTEELSLMAMSGVVREVDLIINANINRYVQRALDEIEGFAEQPIKEQIAKMVEYAKADKAELTAAAKPEPEPIDDDPEAA